MSTRIRFGRGVALVAVALLGAVGAARQEAASRPDPTGEWRATIVSSGVEIPFRFEVVARGESLAASFFNGDRRVTSTSSAFEAGSWRFAFDQYASTLTVSVIDGQLTGEYRRGTRAPYPFRATKGAGVDPSTVAQAASAPSIAGTWIVQAKSNKGERAWRFIARDDRGVVSATVLRVDGDTGTLTGTYRDGRWVLSHFSGARPLLLEAIPQLDGRLTLRQNGKTELLAVKESDARAGDIGVPTDPSRHTTVVDESQPFRFSFPDLQGRLVSHTDAKFEGKVVVVNISGSWCPNCHDEAPFLSALYKKYKDRGLEIVTLSFEEEDQLANPTRLRAFIETYRLDYTVLLAGNPEEVNERIPQAVNLDAFPTTFLVGRDGKVKGVHVGFPSPGSGEFYVKAERDVTAAVESLLNERAGTAQ